MKKSSLFNDVMPEVKGLSPDTKVHRIIDFYSAAEIVERNSLYVPLAKSFHDMNEGIDAAINYLSIASGPCAGITRHFRNREEFLIHQQKIAKQNYVSCWTRTKESVAMWALYSPDKCSVQITTTVKDLECAALELAKTSGDPRPEIAVGRRFGQSLYGSSISPVTYDDLAILAKKIDRRRRAYDKLERMGKIKTIAAHTDWSRRDRIRMDQYQFDTLTLKDSSYAHESEIRLILNFSPYTPETLSSAAIQLNDMENRPDTNKSRPDYDLAMAWYARAVLKEEASSLESDCDESIMLSLHDNFVSEVTIDPRCEAHKRKFITSFFEKHGVTLTESKCFGFAGHNFSVTPRRKILQRGNNDTA